jgi:hypothetical protein
MIFIKATLEEREREEFVRLKKVKVVLDKRKTAEQMQHTEQQKKQAAPLIQEKVSTK